MAENDEHEPPWQEMFDALPMHTAPDWFLAFAAEHGWTPKS